MNWLIEKISEGADKTAVIFKEKIIRTRFSIRVSVRIMSG